MISWIPKVFVGCRNSVILGMLMTHDITWMAKILMGIVWLWSLLEGALVVQEVLVCILDAAHLQELDAATTVAMMATGPGIAKQVIGGINAIVVDNVGTLSGTVGTAPSWTAGRFKLCIFSKCGPEDLVIPIYLETVSLVTYLLLFAVHLGHGPDPQGDMAGAEGAFLAAGVWATVVRQ
jgi:hypothetical protein